MTRLIHPITWFLTLALLGTAVSPAFALRARSIGDDTPSETTLGTTLRRAGGLEEGRTRRPRSDYGGEWATARRLLDALTARASASLATVSLDAQGVLIVEVADAVALVDSVSIQRLPWRARTNKWLTAVFGGSANALNPRGVDALKALAKRFRASVPECRGIQIVTRAPAPGVPHDLSAQDAVGTILEKLAAAAHGGRIVVAPKPRVRDVFTVHVAGALVGTARPGLRDKTYEVFLSYQGAQLAGAMHPQALRGRPPAWTAEVNDWFAKA